jgi:hypothetical protein
MSSTGKNAKAVQVANMITGTKKRFPNGTQQVTVGGVTRTIDQLTAELQTFVDNRTAVETAQATAKAKVEAERAQAPSLLALIAAYVTFVRLNFGNAPDALIDFDIPPTKTRTPLTTEAKAVAAAKRAATRTARGTTSKKAKKNVKGNITATLVVTPSASPAPSTPVASPVPSTPVASPAPAASGNAPAGGTPATPTAHS